MNLIDIPASLRDYFEHTPDALDGKLCLRGTRVSIEQILELLVAGVTSEEIVQSFPSVILSVITAFGSLAAHCMTTKPRTVGDLVKTYKFEHQPTETAMQGRNLRYVSARASFRAGKRKNGNYRLRQNHR